jgi:CRISPR/Cas system type I-B associated protein Csh2 (Cas7 group RAMP superfamily)
MKAKALPGKVARTKKATRTRIGLILTAVLVALTIGTIALSRTSTQAQKKKYVATKATIRDDASGQLRKPTAEETEAIVDQLKTLTNRSSEGLTAKQLTNGTKQVTLDGRFSGVVLGVAKEDGTTEIRCVTTMEEAIAFLGLQESSVNQ